MDRRSFLALGATASLAGRLDAIGRGVYLGGVRLSAAGTVSLSQDGCVRYEAERPGTVCPYGD